MGGARGQRWRVTDGEREAWPMTCLRAFVCLLLQSLFADPSRLRRRLAKPSKAAITAQKRRLPRKWMGGQ